MLVKLSILVLCHTVIAVLLKPKYDMENLDLVKSLFDSFIANYKRTYDAAEKIQRFQYFMESLVEINLSNKDNPMAVFDINEFSDWSPAEKQNLFGYNGGQRLGDDLCDYVNISTHDAPDALDWKDKGAVTPVKYQGHCGSCWAFSATAAVESSYALKHKKQVSFSEQQLVDCAVPFGCMGGWMDIALSTLINEGGQELESDYPYVAKDGYFCDFNSSKIAAKVTACHHWYTMDEDQLKQTLFKVGPLSISLDGYPLKYYESGILTNCSAHVLNHAVLLTGYGIDNGSDFWIIKNSWGEKWGEQGFGRIYRGNGCIGIGQEVLSADVA